MDDITYDTDRDCWILNGQPMTSYQELVDRVRPTSPDAEDAQFLAERDR